MIIISTEEYLRERLEWVKFRMEMLDEIELKLKEMKKTAEYAKENKLEPEQKEKLNLQLQKLQHQVNELDEKSRTFWMDFQ